MGYRSIFSTTASATGPNGITFRRTSPRVFRSRSHGGVLQGLPQLPSSQTAPPAALPENVQAGPSIPRTVDEAWDFFGIKKKRATEAQIKKLYRKFMMRNHPDRHPDEQEEAQFQSMCANAAWDILRSHCHW